MKRIIFLLLFFSPCLYGQTKVGSTAAPFLNIGVGPRAVAMGAAFVATANDLTALYWNPAGVARMESNGALFAHTEWFAGISYNWAGIVLNLGQYGSTGLSITYLNYGEMEVTTLNEQDGTGEYFSAKDVAISLTYSYNLSDRFSLGLSAKYINQRIWNCSAEAFAMDLGTLFISDVYGLRIGAAISNFGTEMQLDGKDLFVLHDINPGSEGNNDQILSKLNTDAYALPLVFRVGIAKDFIHQSNRLTIGIDAIHPNDNAEAINIGGEYSFSENIFLRAGYKSAFMQNSEEGFTLGFGLKYELSPGISANLDYAYQDFGILSYTQHFGIGINF